MVKPRERLSATAHPQQVSHLTGEMKVNSLPAVTGLRLKHLTKGKNKPVLLFAVKTATVGIAMLITSSNVDQWSSFSVLSVDHITFIPISFLPYVSY